MKARTVLIPLVIAVAGCGLLGWWWLSDGTTTRFRTVEIERDDVRAVVTSTGTLKAVATVEVGTQISGIVSEIHADFNDEVSEGAILARIDTTLLSADVAAARARLTAAVATRERLDREVVRMRDLVAARGVSANELEQAETDAKVAAADVQSARVAMDRASKNVGYATISSPITGTVVRRDVELGQTVSASTSAPTLFLIAGNLAHMQILAAVDESDIGKIHEGQTVLYTVAAWPDEERKGTVNQVRLQSTSAESVVTYTVVVDVLNEDRKLLPGMTATAEFLVAESKDVLCVAPSALRFRPEAAQLASGQSIPDVGGGGRERGKRGGSAPSSHGGTSFPAKEAEREGPPKKQGVLYTTDADEKLVPHVVTVGLVGRSCTEVSGDGLEEGLAVVAGIEASTSSGSSSPFQQRSSQPSGGSWRGRGGGF